MTLDEILDTWEKDAQLRHDELGRDSEAIPKLQQKYMRWFIYERLQLRQIESDFKKKRLEAYTYYTEGPSKDATGNRDPREFPARGVILKTDANMYLDSDTILAKERMKVELQQAKVDALEMILKTINNRSYHIRDAIEWIKWQGGN
jgi:hypothetical protein